LGFPRKEGDKKDCYAVFTKMLKKGQFPSSLKDIIDNLALEKINSNLVLL
jgi:toxin YhaV